MSAPDELDLTELRREWQRRRDALQEILTRIDARGMTRPARDADERAWLEQRGEIRLVEDEAMADSAMEYYARRYRHPDGDVPPPDLPGADLVFAGIDDLERGAETVPALLVSIGAPRLRRIGYAVPPNTPADPEQRLYLLLAREDADTAHGRYNALVRRLVSFERAAEGLRP